MSRGGLHKHWGSPRHLDPKRILRAYCVSMEPDELTLDEELSELDCFQVEMLDSPLFDEDDLIFMEEFSQLMGSLE